MTLLSGKFISEIVPVGVCIVGGGGGVWRWRFGGWLRRRDTGHCKRPVYLPFGMLKDNFPLNFPPCYFSLDPYLHPCATLLGSFFYFCCDNSLFVPRPHGQNVINLCYNLRIVMSIFYYVIAQRCSPILLLICKNLDLRIISIIIFDTIYYYHYY